MITELVNTNTVEDFKEMVNVEDITVVKFFADWCGPCQMLKPVFKKVAEETVEYKYLEGNIDVVGNIAKEYGVRSIPTIVAFKNGEEIGRETGFMPEGKLKLWFDGLKK